MNKPYIEAKYKNPETEKELNHLRINFEGLANMIGREIPVEQDACFVQAVMDLNTIFQHVVDCHEK